MISLFVVEFQQIVHSYATHTEPVLHMIPALAIVDGEETPNVLSFLVMVSGIVNLTGSVFSIILVNVARVLEDLIVLYDHALVNGVVAVIMVFALIPISVPAFLSILDSNVSGWIVIPPPRINLLTLQRDVHLLAIAKLLEQTQQSVSVILDFLEIIVKKKLVEMVE